MATNPVAAQPQIASAPSQPQYPGESLYLPQPDYSGHPGMRATLPAPTRHHLRLIAAISMLLIVLAAGGLSVWFFHYPIDLTTQNKPKTAVSTSASTLSTATDTARRKGLKAVQAQLEAYFIQTGRYPLLSQLNSPDWVVTNMPDLKQVLKANPDHIAQTQATKPAAKQYSYQVYADGSEASCEATPARCIVYVLTATLSNGSSYVLRSATA